MRLWCIVRLKKVLKIANANFMKLQTKTLVYIQGKVQVSSCLRLGETIFVENAVLV